jgi:hypothetical protein
MSCSVDPHVAKSTTSTVVDGEQSPPHSGGFTAGEGLQSVTLGLGTALVLTCQEQILAASGIRIQNLRLSVSTSISLLGSH